MIKILISVLTFNGGEKTIKTINDILAQIFDANKIEINLIVVDNHSTNGISDKLKEKFHSINIIKTKDNLGFSDGNNHAIDIAISGDYDYLFVLNDDLQIKTDYIQNVINAAEKISPSPAAIGTTIRLLDGTIQAVSGSIAWWFVSPIWSKRVEPSESGFGREVDVVQGAAFVLTKEALRRGFRFDKNLFFGGEEYDLGNWAIKNNLKIIVLDNIEVIHDTNQSKLIKNRWHADPLHYYYSTRNHTYLKKKYYKNPLEFFVANVYSLFRSIIKSLIFYIKGDKKTLIYVLRGFKDALSNKMGKHKI